MVIEICGVPGTWNVQNNFRIVLEGVQQTPPQKKRGTIGAFPSPMAIEPTVQLVHWFTHNTNAQENPTMQRSTSIGTSAIPPRHKQNATRRCTYIFSAHACTTEQDKYLRRQAREVPPSSGGRHLHKATEIGRVVVAPSAAGNNAERSSVVIGERRRHLEVEVEP